MRLSCNRDVLRELRADTGLSATKSVVAARCGCSTDAQMAAVQRDIAVLEECGVPFGLLEAMPSASAEPARSGASGQTHGGLRLLAGEDGDCHLFSRRLAGWRRRWG